MTSRGRVAVLAALIFGFAALAGAQPPDASAKRDAALANVTSGPVRVIISTQPGATPAIADSLRARGRAVGRTCARRSSGSTC
jgi:hypothetical protein